MRLTRLDWLLARRDEAAREFRGVIHLARPGASFEVRTPGARQAG